MTDIYAAMSARDASFRDQLDHIGRIIGYGRAIQLLGQLWDDMLQASYPNVGRHQEGMFRRTDIERIEAGLPIGRKLVYVPRRGRKGTVSVTTWSDFGAEIRNVGRVISDTPLFALLPSTQEADDNGGA